MILFPSKLFEIITNSGEEFYPTEACGLVIGREEYNSFKTVTQIIKSKNVAHIDPSHHFQIDPQVQFDTIRMLAKQNDIGTTEEKIIGHYHSHPDQPAYPSDTDINMVYEANLFWLITSVIRGKSIDTKGYIFNKKTNTFDKVGLHISHKDV